MWKPVNIEDLEARFPPTIPIGLAVTKINVVDFLTHMFSLFLFFKFRTMLLQ